MALGRFVKGISLTVAAACFGMSAAAMQLEGDVERGAKIYRKCASCHKIGEGAVNRTGPHLNELIGRVAGSIEGYRYSNVMAESGVVWTVEELDAFLEKPRTYMDGTKMSFAGLRKEQDRIDVIAYLATFTHDLENASANHDEFTVAPEILAIEGDVAYGEYLSSECTTCHQASGGNDGIPPINGWHTDDFVTALHAYREKHRENPVMQLVTGRLSDEEIAALAAYFEGLE